MAGLFTMTEHDLLNAIRLAASRHGARLFRNNVAKGWVGRLVSHRGGTVVLADARPLHAGLCTGSSDLIGWDAVGRFLAVEGKMGRTRTTDDQAAFLAAVEAAGGVAVLARSVEDVVAALKN